jgi:UDPglucose 6-dehydrogenase
MRKLYAPINRNHDRLMRMSIHSAELTKYAANAMLATRISFMNELANLADEVGADIEQVRLGIGSDSRIGQLSMPAPVTAVPVFRKTCRRCRTAAEWGHPMRVLEAVEEANHEQLACWCKLTARLGEDLRGNLAIWGLAFKPNTDDMRRRRAATSSASCSTAAPACAPTTRWPRRRRCAARLDLAGARRCW